MALVGELLTSQAGLDAIIAAAGGAAGGPAVPLKRFVLQASDAPSLRAQAVAAFVEVVALNAAIAAFYVANPTLVQQLTLVYGNAELAGGGDGHTFTLTIDFVNGVGTGVGTGPSASFQQLLFVAFLAANPQFEGIQPTPDHLGVQTYLASDKDALMIAGQQAIAAAQADSLSRAPVAVGATPQPAVFCYLNAVAGAAKGTRFMGAMIYVGMQTVPPIG